MMMKREKLDDYMSFPFVLNMNNYLRLYDVIYKDSGYDGIKNKLNEEPDHKYFEEELRRATYLPLTKQPTS